MGLWELPAERPEAGESFAVGEAGAPASHWSVNLPADSQSAAALLDQAEAALHASQAALEAAPTALEHLAAQAGSKGLAFSVGGEASALTPAEIGALRLLQDSGLAGDLLPESLSFAAGEPPGAAFGLAAGDFRQGVEKIGQMALYLAWVETQVDGQWTGRTVVDWSGDACTSWARGVSNERMALHQRNLRLALETRLALLSTLTVAVQGAAKLGVLLSTPAGALLALPAAWKYVNQLIQEVGKVQALSRPKEDNHGQ